MGNIKDLFVTFISNTKNALLLAGASVIVLLLLLNHWNVNKLRKAEEKVQRTEQNLQAAQDTIRITRARNNTIEYNKLAYLATDLKELKELNASLAKEVEITKGQVLAIQKVGFQIKTDTQYIPTTVYVQDSAVYLASKLDTTYSAGNFRTLAFKSVYNLRDTAAYTLLTEDKIGFTATVGLKKNEQDRYEIFVRPNYPNMTVGKLEGAVIEDNLIKKETKIPLITLGGHIGWTPFTYDFVNRKTDLNLNRIGVSVGLNFNLAAMLKK
jgi:hypothetical protein